MRQARRGDSITSSVLVAPTRRQTSSRRLLFSGPGRFTDLAWSPDGDWLLVAWKDADQWLFINLKRPERVRAVGNISSQFDPGGDGHGAVSKGLRMVLSRVAAAVCVLVVALTVTGCGDSERAADGTNVGSEALGELGSGWTELPTPPRSRSEAAYVWTGTELIVWGGCGRYAVGCRGSRKGYSYSPETGEWRDLPDAPVGAAGPSGVWTGSEILFIDVGHDCELVRPRGTAYSPESNTWRVLPRVPLRAGERCEPVMAWTGEELVLLSGLAYDRLAPDPSSAAYDPDSDRWRPLAKLPKATGAARYASNPRSAIWTGERVIAFGTRPPGRRLGGARGASYDPAADRWTALPSSRLTPLATATAWTGDRLLAWDYELRSQEYDPATRTWSPRVKLPLAFWECYPETVSVGQFVFAYLCGQAALYDSREGTWEALSSEDPRARDLPISESGPLGATFVASSNSAPQSRRFPYYTAMDALVTAGDVAILALRAPYRKPPPRCSDCGARTALWAFRTR